MHHEKETRVSTPAPPTKHEYGRRYALTVQVISATSSGYGFEASRAASHALTCAFSDWSSDFSAAFSLASSDLSSAFDVLADFSAAFSLLLPVFSDESSLASAALHMSVDFAESVSCSDLLEAMALTHWPWTPLGPCGQVRAADATSSPWESELVREMAPTLASTPAPPRARAAPAFGVETDPQSDSSLAERELSFLVRLAQAAASTQKPDELLDLIIGEATSAMGTD